jgi:hypothetical protein
MIEFAIPFRHKPSGFYKAFDISNIFKVYVTVYQMKICQIGKVRFHETDQ